MENSESRSKFQFGGSLSGGLDRNARVLLTELRPKTIADMGAGAENTEKCAGIFRILCRKGTPGTFT